MGNSNIKQESSNVLGNGNFGGQVVAKGGVVSSTGAFDHISVQTAKISGSGAFGEISGQTANISGDSNFGNITTSGSVTGKSINISGTGTFGSISGTSLALQKGDIIWGFNITDKNDLCITQNGTNLTCISQKGVLY
jgi:hypothetical protein